MTESTSRSVSVWDRIREQLHALRTAAESGRNSADSLAERLAHRAKVLRSRMQTGEDDVGARQLILAFYKGSERYGVPVSDVVEVQPLEHYTPVPQAPPFLRGVVHCRGAILSLIDLGILFDVPASGLADVHIYIVIEAAGRRIGVAAGDVEEIVMVPEEQIKPAPELPAQVHPDWILGVHDENRLILRMNTVLQSERLSNWRSQ